MNKNAYELSADNKIQLLMEVYGRPDRGISINLIENLPFTKSDISNAINVASQVSQQKAIEVQDYDLHDDDKQKIINTYSGYAFLKQLNFDVTFDDKFNVEQGVLPELSVAGYAYYNYDEQSGRRLEYDVSIEHCIFDLIKVITKNHYGRVKVSDFEELQKVTSDSLNTGNVVERMQQIKNVINPSERTLKNNQPN